MKKKIIYVILGNAGTFGHFQRMLNLAEGGLISEDKRLMVIGDELLPVVLKNFLEKKNIKYFFIKSEKAHPSNGGMLFSNYARNILPILNREKPEIVIYDTFFPKDIQAINNQILCKKIFISRSFSKRQFYFFVKNGYNKFFNRVIFAEKFSGQKNFSNVVFHSAILRSINKGAVLEIRKKYGIKRGNFNALFLCGGGGYEGTERIVELFLNLSIRLVQDRDNFRVIIILGPFSRFNKRESDRGKIIIKRFEENLPELMCCSDLIVSLAGYNSINESLKCRKPLILIPVYRHNDDQFFRAEKLKSKKCHLFGMDDVKMIFETIKFYCEKTPRTEKIAVSLNAIKANKRIIQSILSS